MTTKKGIPPTVGNFIAVLTSELTQYDQKVSARERHVNIYRLGHLLEAAHGVEKEILRRAKADDTMTPQIAELMVDSMAEHFTVSPKADNFDLAPCRNVLKKLAAFLDSGKNPSLVAPR